MGWLLACAAAIAARLVIMAYTAGTQDIYTWGRFAESIGRVGLFESYRTIPDLNHPPLGALWALAAARLSGASGLSFPFTFKLMPLAGDLLAAGLLFRCARRTAATEGALKLACLFLWNPVSLLVTGYHGNTDPLMAALCLWAALRAERGDSLGTALALGGALNVKVVSLVLLVPLALSVRGRRQAVRFAAGLLVACVPFVPALIQVGRPFVEHVFSYKPALGMWGFNLLFTDLLELRRFGHWFAAPRVAFLANTRYAILVVPALVALIMRLRGGRRWMAACAFGLCLSLVLAPGFGYQYLAWPMPLLFALNTRRAMVASLPGGMLLGLLYLHYWDGAMPAMSWTSTWPRFGVLWGFVAWCLLCGWSLRLGRSVLLDQPLETSSGGAGADGPVTGVSLGMPGLNGDDR